MSYLGRSAKLSLKAQEKVSFLATAGQTVKTGLSYTPSFVEVYVNGVLLTDTTDFTATNGNSITFTVALLLNDEVTVISLKTFTVADHYNKTEADTLLAAKATVANFTSTGIDDNATSTAVTLDSSGSVLIGGTTVASSAGGLNVETTSSGNVTSTIVMQNQATGNNSGVNLAFRGQRNSGAQADYTYIQSVADDTAAGNGSIRFHTALGGTIAERMRINADGIVTKPLQPCFSATRSSDQSIAQDTTTLVALDVREFDIGNNFSTSTNRFTAPVAGRYLFTAAIQYGASSPSTCHTNLYINGGSRNDGWIDYGDAKASTQSRIFDLVSGDYVQLYAHIGISATMSAYRMKMTGFLIG